MKLLGRPMIWTRRRPGVRDVLSALLVISLAVCTHSLAAQDKATLNVQTDMDWWHAPEGKFVGGISAVAVGPDGSVWVLHRPNSVAEQERANAAPPVLKYDQEGRFLAGYGGPGPLDQHADRFGRRGVDGRHLRGRQDRQHAPSSVRPPSRPAQNGQ